MEKIISLLITKYHVRIIDIITFSVVVSYKDQLDEIAKDHNCTLEEWANSASKLTVWGKFVLN